MLGVSVTCSSWFLAFDKDSDTQDERNLDLFSRKSSLNYLRAFEA
jgi:hypothetical protein